MIANRMLDKIIKITLNGNFCHELTNNQSLYTFYTKVKTLKRSIAKLIARWRYLKCLSHSTEID